MHIKHTLLLIKPFNFNTAFGGLVRFKMVHKGRTIINITRINNAGFPRRKNHVMAYHQGVIGCVFSNSNPCGTPPFKFTQGDVEFLRPGQVFNDNTVAKRLA